MYRSPSDGWKVAAALLAKNIGGGINYIAVATTLSVSPTVIAAGITVDNIFALVYFPLLGALGNLREAEEEVVPIERVTASFSAVDNSQTSVWYTCAIALARGRTGF